MKIIDGNDAFALYSKVLLNYEAIIKKYAHRFIDLNKNERVYIIQDSLVVYVGLINFGDSIFPCYRIMLEELLYNTIFKFNFSKFSHSFRKEEQGLILYKRFHGIWGEPVRSLEDNIYSDKFSDEYKQHYLIPSKADEISTAIPSLHLKDRFDQWEGNLYYYIIYELIENNRKGYAIYCSQNPKMHKTAYEIANQIEWKALEYYSYQASKKAANNLRPDYSRYQFDMAIFSDGVNCDSTIIDLLCEKIELHKASGWMNKANKHIASERLCLAEHDLKYFILNRYAKTKAAAYATGKELFAEVHKGEYANEPRFEYIIPENKWKSEQMVFEMTKRLFKQYTVLYQHRPYFLHTEKGQMSYDVYICGLEVAIEYQGKQHFEPVEIFGGKEHFTSQVDRDKLKQELSEKNGVALVYINYDDDLSPDLIKTRIEAGLKKRNMIQQ